MRAHHAIILCAAACATTSTSEREGASTDVVKATIAPQQTIDLTRQTAIHAEEFAATRDQVWDALLAAPRDLGIPVRSADPTAGVVVYYLEGSTARIAGKPPSTLLDCGRGPGGAPRAETYQMTLRVTAVVEPAAEHRTRVSTTLVAFARDRGMSADALPCTSTGALEREFLTVVAARLPS